MGDTVGLAVGSGVVGDLVRSGTGAPVLKENGASVGGGFSAEGASVG